MFGRCYSPADETPAYPSPRLPATNQAACERAVLEAGEAIFAYLDTPLAGLWRDRLNPEGTFVDEPAPASSLCHLTGAIGALKEAALDAASASGAAELRREDVR